MSKNPTASAVSEQSLQDQVIVTLGFFFATGSYGNIHSNEMICAMSRSAFAKSVGLMCELYNTDFAAYQEFVNVLQSLSVADFKNGASSYANKDINYASLEGDSGQQIAYKTAELYGEMRHLEESWEDMTPDQKEYFKLYTAMQAASAPAHFVDRSTGDVKLVASNDIFVALTLATGACADSQVGDVVGKYTQISISALQDNIEIYRGFEDQEVASEIILVTQNAIKYARSEFVEAPSAAVAASEAVSAEVGEAVAAPETDLPLVGADADVVTAE